MLPKSFRLRQSADLQRVRRRGQSWRHPLAVLLVHESGPTMLDRSRFAFVAGRRVGNAVVRNRVKRLLREAVRHHVDDIEAGWDCMLIARNALADASYIEVETAVSELLTRANLLHQNGAGE